MAQKIIIIINNNNNFCINVLVRFEKLAASIFGAEKLIHFTMLFSSTNQHIFVKH
jgi:hypothetical protein